MKLKRPLEYFKIDDIVRLVTDNPNCAHKCGDKKCKYYNHPLRIIDGYSNRWGIIFNDAKNTSLGWCSGPQERDLKKIEGVSFEF